MTNEPGIPLYMARDGFGPSTEVAELKAAVWPKFR